MLREGGREGGRGKVGQVIKNKQQCILTPLCSVTFDTTCTFLPNHYWLRACSFLKVQNNTYKITVIVLLLPMLSVIAWCATPSVGKVYNSLTAVVCACVCVRICVCVSEVVTQLVGPAMKELFSVAIAVAIFLSVAHGQCQVSPSN